MFLPLRSDDEPHFPSMLCSNSSSFFSDPGEDEAWWGLSHRHMYNPFAYMLHRMLEVQYTSSIAVQSQSQQLNVCPVRWERAWNQSNWKQIWKWTMMIQTKQLPVRNCSNSSCVWNILEECHTHEEFENVLETKVIENRFENEQWWYKQSNFPWETVQIPHVFGTSLKSAVQIRTTDLCPVTCWSNYYPAAMCCQVCL